jgi:hypothetical protein
MLDFLNHRDAAEIRRVGERGRERVLAEHTSRRRAEEFENQITHVHSRLEPRPLLHCTAAVPDLKAEADEEYQPFPKAFAS